MTIKFARLGIFLGVAMFAFLTGQANAQTSLTSGVALTNLSGAQGSQVFYKITVPAAQAKLEVKITGAGDCDLYVKRGAAHDFELRLPALHQQQQ